MCALITLICTVQVPVPAIVCVECYL